MLQSVGLIVIVTSACMTGVAVFAYYAMKGCDPLTNGDIMSSNQVRNLYSFLKKKPFSDYQTYPLRLKINKHCFLQFYLYVQYVDTSSYKLNIVW